jgi:tRNA threonylcarbamoyladenosine biosynthesis protein TsaB
MNQKPIINNRAIFSIDTSSNQEIRVALMIDGQKDEIKESIGKQKSQVVLVMIQELLKKHELEFSAVTGVEVVLGPGSFTGLRVGVAIANTLGTILQIPINGLPLGQLVEPQYT